MRDAAASAEGTAVATVAAWLWAEHIGTLATRPELSTRPAETVLMPIVLIREGLSVIDPGERARRRSRTCSYGWGGGGGKTKGSPPPRLRGTIHFPQKS